MAAEYSEERSQEKEDIKMVFLFKSCQTYVQKKQNNYYFTKKFCDKSALIIKIVTKLHILLLQTFINLV